MSLFAWMGFSSAFFLGPVSFQLIKSLVIKKTIPWSGLVGLIIADVLHLTIVVMSIFYMPVPLGVLDTWLLIPTILILGYMGFKIILREYSLNESLEENLSFKVSFISTILNAHILLFYFGLFISQKSKGLAAMMSSVSIYFIFFILGISFLMASTYWLRERLSSCFRGISIVLGGSFVLFAMYLSNQLVQIF
jgi:threonine/homoserine/homoserine lactone efflux protein